MNIKIFRLFIFFIFISVLKLPVIAQSEIEFIKIQALIYQNNVDSALKYAGFAYDEYSNNEEIGIVYADLLSKDFPQKALSIYEKFSNDNEINLKKARIVAGLGQYDKALTFLEKYLSENHKLSKSALYSFPEFSKLQKMPAWRDLMGRINEPEFQKVIFDAEFFSKNGNVSKAIDILDNFLLNAKQHKVYATRARILKQQNEYESAFFDFKRAFDLYPLPEYKKGMAECMFLLGKYNKANKYFQQYFSNQKNDFSALKLSAISQFKAKKWDQASILAFRYLKYISNDTLESIVAENFKQKGNYLEALKYFSLAIAQNPYNKYYYKERGLIYFSFENYKVAEMDFTLYLDYKPRDTDILYKRGICRYFENKLKGACSDWKSASKLYHLEASKMIKKYCE